MMVQLLSTDGLKYLKPYLLEATARAVRSNFSALLERAFANLVKHRAGDSDVAAVNVILSALVEMMASNVADNVKHCGQYFIISSESRRDLAVHRRDLRHSKLGGGGRNRSSGRRRPDGLKSLFVIYHICPVICQTIINVLFLFQFWHSLLKSIK